MYMLHTSAMSSCELPYLLLSFFFFNDTATTEIYTLSLHDALPISVTVARSKPLRAKTTAAAARICVRRVPSRRALARSEEHTSELQSLTNLVCRLLLEKKKTQHNNYY